MGDSRLRRCQCSRWTPGILTTTTLVLLCALTNSRLNDCMHRRSDLVLGRNFVVGLCSTYTKVNDDAALECLLFEISPIPQSVTMGVVLDNYRLTLTLRIRILRLLRKAAACIHKKLCYCTHTNEREIPYRWSFTART